MRPAVLAILPGICLLLLVAGCGGGGGAPTAPTPSTTTLTLDFRYIEVLDDCDDIEGVGDFQFRIEILHSKRTELVYDAGINLGSGSRTPAIGRWSHTFDATKNEIVGLTFTASELDKSIFGVTYNDQRLDEAKRGWSHNYVGGTWGTLGAQSLTIGGGEVANVGCRVRLVWTATAT